VSALIPLDHLSCWCCASVCPVNSAEFHVHESDSIFDW